jgi:hypothetical protein
MTNEANSLLAYLFFVLPFKFRLLPQQRAMPHKKGRSSFAL